MTKNNAVQFTYGGELKHDYIGAHIVYVRDAMQYLGTVTGIYRDEDDVVTFQEAAPDVPAGLAFVLERP
jgi:hypothetical protein